MSWSGIANNQTISEDNIKDAVGTNVFTPINTIPAGLQQITKADAASFVCLDETYAPFLAKASNQLVIKTDCIPCATGCSCPTDYVSNPDGTFCTKTTTVPATPAGGGDVFACHFTNVNYAVYGLAIYQPGAYASDGTYTSPPANLQAAWGLGGTYSNTLWVNTSPASLSKGRLNSTGIWKCSDGNYTGTLGFSRQINIPTTKQYYIGIGADNTATFKINGTTIVAQNSSALGVQYTGVSDDTVTFRIWHVYPVTLNAGPNLLEISGTNSGGPGVFGCEIYDATESDLLGCNTESDLIPFLIFTTANIPTLGVGNYVADNDPFVVGSYTCSAGYTLLFEDGAYICRKIETTACL